MSPHEDTFLPASVCHDCPHARSRPNPSLSHGEKKVSGRFSTKGPSMNTFSLLIQPAKHSEQRRGTRRKRVTNGECPHFGFPHFGFSTLSYPAIRRCSLSLSGSPLR